MGKVEIIKMQIAAVESLLVDLKQQLASVEAEEHQFDWQLICDRLGILTDHRQRYGWHQTTYIGFETKKKAEEMVKRLKTAADWCASHNKPNAFVAIELRQADRLISCKWELKITELCLELINKICGEINDIRDRAA